MLTQEKAAKEEETSMWPRSRERGNVNDEPRHVAGNENFNVAALT